MAERKFLSGSVAEASRSVGRWARSMGDMSGSLKEKSGPGSTSAAPGGKTDGVTAAQREAFHETFVMFDVDGGGTIDASELSAVMQSLGHDPSEEELDQMIAEVDVDGNGEIDFDEFCVMMKNMMHSHDSLHDVKLAFEVFDVDGSGSISKAELKKAVCHSGQRISEAEFEDLFKETDTNNDGEIDFEEFVAILTS